uniref:Uncharacterized protein n=1 Tax=Opuntia streptacantha TaxID=393608 RepID=A0A7C9AEH6_OPUST
MRLLSLRSCNDVGIQLNSLMSLMSFLSLFGVLVLRNGRLGIKAFGFLPTMMSQSIVDLVSLPVCFLLGETVKSRLRIVLKYLTRVGIWILNLLLNQLKMMLYHLLKLVMMVFRVCLWNVA